MKIWKGRWFPSVTKYIKGQTKNKLLKLKLVWYVQSQYFVVFILLLFASCLQAVPSIFSHAIVLKQHFDFLVNQFFLNKLLFQIFVTYFCCCQVIWFHGKSLALGQDDCTGSACHVRKCCETLRGIGAIHSSDKLFFLLA